MIRIENIKKAFRKFPVLKNISTEFKKGQVVSLIGPNGSGKTTLIKSILGMVKPDSGQIFFNNQPIKDSFQYRDQIGYMPQIGRYPDNIKVGQLMSMMKLIRGVDATDNDLYEQFNLESIENKPMRTLSGGTRQKVSAAIAFLFNPDVLILDEPTGGLDPLSSEILKEKIVQEKNKNKLILITSHILSDLDELTTHVLYLQEGAVQSDKSIEDLRNETGEKKLGKAIARIMRGGRLSLHQIRQAQILGS